MILELATIDIKQGTNAEFETNLKKAQSVISKLFDKIGYSANASPEGWRDYLFGKYRQCKRQ